MKTRAHFHGRVFLFAMMKAARYSASMLKDPLYRTTVILLIVSAYVLIRQAVLEEPTDEAESPPTSVVNMANLKQYRLGDYRLEIPAPFVHHVATGMGKTENIVTGFIYPAMEPVDPGERNRTGLGEKVKATLYAKATCEGNAPCDDYTLLQYKKRLFGDISPFVQKMPEIPVTDEGEFSRFNLTYKDEQYKMYVIGDTQNPTEWYYCKDAGEKSYCSSFYRLDENLVAELTFDAALLPSHAELRAKVSETLRSFIYFKQER